MRFGIFALILTIFASPVIAGGHLASERGEKAGRFARADANGDNQISRDEFIALAEKRFAKMDKNGDGMLTPDEMRRPRHNHGSN